MYVGVKMALVKVRDDLKLPDDSGEVPKLNGVVGGSIPNREIVSLLGGKLARWSSASCVTKKRKGKERKSGASYVEVGYGLPV